MSGEVSRIKSTKATVKARCCWCATSRPLSWIAAALGTFTLLYLSLLLGLSPLTGTAKSRHSRHGGHPAAGTHLLHHLLCLDEAVDELVDGRDLDTGALGDALRSGDLSCSLIELLLPQSAQLGIKGGNHTDTQATLRECRVCQRSQDGARTRQATGFEHNTSNWWCTLVW